MLNLGRRLVLEHQYIVVLNNVLPSSRCIGPACIPRLSF
jgi:hypothetical protein